MKKRKMKKYIPKNTSYCGSCRWLKLVNITNVSKSNCQFSDNCGEDCWTKPSNSCVIKVWKCEYIQYTDYNEDSLLFDGCKECGVSEGFR